MNRFKGTKALYALAIGTFLYAVSLLGTVAFTRGQPSWLSTFHYAFFNLMRALPIAAAALTTGILLLPVCSPTSISAKMEWNQSGLSRNYFRHHTCN